ncbi:Mu transposase C-terminal domain-containing protein [Novosphingobium sp.]|uniref:Mu transposase C-terminal domain-containing protein n=3 Tax=unclassified Novosphingobium TaxID=2644732 RepID=UPI002FDF239A
MQVAKTASDADWEEARRREMVIRPLANCPRISAEVATEAMSKLGLQRSRFHELLQRYRAAPCAASLLPGKRGRTCGSRNLSADVEQLISRGIEEHYLTREKPSVQALRRWLDHECRKSGIRPPSTKAITARVQALPPVSTARRRLGAKAANDRWEPNRAAMEAGFALEVVQSDHTLVDVIVVDDLYRKPIGRPWLTVMIDIASRTIPGFHLDLLAPSAVSVGMCMRHAVLPKDDWLAERGLAAPWPNYGLMDRLHLDNAREHHSEALRRGCRTYSIELEYRPIKRPHFGGHIERLIGTMMGAVHLLPGTTFSNVLEKGEYDADGRACMTMAELEAWLTAQIIGPYHAERHRSLGIPPSLAWDEAIARRPELMRLPLDPGCFLFDFLPCASRAVTPNGIELFNTHYWDDALPCWYTRHGQRMAVRWDPRDLSRVWLELPDGDHLEVPYRDLRRPAITRWEQRQAVQAIRAKGLDARNEALIFAAVETQRAIISEAAHKTKAARLALQRTRKALSDAHRARESVFPVSTEKKPQEPLLEDKVTLQEPARLPFVVEEMRR